jgi:small GTP-binding protein
MLIIYYLVYSMAYTVPTHIVRLLTLGDTSVGKSSLLLRYTQHEFISEYQATIGIDFRLRNFELNDGQKTKQFKIQIWDTAGQERFRTITHNYYRGAHGILLVYDITNAISFNNISKWLDDVKSYATHDIKIILIGNKYDLVEQDNTCRHVTIQQGLDLAKKYNLQFFECSARNDYHVEEAFACLIKLIVSKENIKTDTKKDTTEITSQYVPIDSSITTSNKCCN